MVLKYDKLFTTFNPLNNASVTFLVEYLEGEDKRVVLIQSLEGKYNSAEEFHEATDRFLDHMQRILDGVPMGNPTKAGKVKRPNSLSLPMSDAHRLVDALSGALEAAEES